MPSFYSNHEKSSDYQQYHIGKTGLSFHFTCSPLIKNYILFWKKEKPYKKLNMKYIMENYFLGFSSLCILATWLSV